MDFRANAKQRIQELEAEVRHLRAELEKCKPEYQTGLSLSDHTTSPTRPEHPAELQNGLASLTMDEATRFTARMSHGGSMGQTDTHRTLSLSQPAGQDAINVPLQRGFFYNGAHQDVQELAFSYDAVDHPSSSNGVHLIDAYVNPGSIAWPMLDGSFIPTIQMDNLEATPSPGSGGIVEPTEIWRLLPLHTEPTCRLDEVICRQRIGSQRQSNPDPHREFSSTTFPSVQSLLNPIEDGSTNPVSSAVAKHSSMWHALGFVEKLAVHYLLSLYVRVSLCGDNYQSGTKRQLVACNAYTSSLRSNP